jgi:ribonuclease D
MIFNEKHYQFGNLNITFHEGDLPSALLTQLGNIVAVDTELTGLDINQDKICLVQVSGDGKNIHLVKFDLTRKYHAPNLIKLLEDEKVVKIFHFRRTDLNFIAKYLKASTKNVFCTKIASHILRRDTDKHSLQDLCLEILGIEISKEEQLSDWSRAKLTDNQVYYAALDVAHLHDLRNKMLRMAFKQNLSSAVGAANSALPAILELDRLGLDESVFSYKRNPVKEKMY